MAGSPELGFRAGARCRQPVCLEDVLPTLLELAGVSCPPVDGVSLLGVLRDEGEEPRLRPWLHFEHATCYSKRQGFQAPTDGRFKYVWRPHDGVEHLFDLDEDPMEEHDLTGDPTQREVLEHWRRVLVQRLADRPEGFSDGKRLITGRPYPPLQGAGRRGAR